MTDAEIMKAFDILDKFDFFGGQRAGRELWFDKPTEIQNKDIENFSKDIAFLKDFIKRQQAEIEKLTDMIHRQSDVVEEQRESIEKLHPYKLHYGNLRMEIAREFADRLKAKPIKCGLPLFGLQTKEEIETYFDGIMLQVKDAIDNLLKEMEKENGKLD